MKKGVEGSYRSRTLAEVDTGVTVRIVAIDGGSDTVRRLLSLGIRVGSDLEVVQRRGKGMVVSCSGTRVALGATIVERLIVEACDASPEPNE